MADAIVIALVGNRSTGVINSGAINIAPEVNRIILSTVPTLCIIVFFLMSVAPNVRSALVEVDRIVTMTTGHGSNF